MRKELACAGLIILLVSLTSCDAFSVKDEFTTPAQRNQANGNTKENKNTVSPLVLQVAKTTLQRKESVDLTVTDGKTPYAYSVSADDLSKHTNTLLLGSINDGKYTADMAIGRIKLTVSDASTPIAETAYIIVTILPPTPENFTAVLVNSNKDCQLRWTFSDPTIISGFTIEKSEDGGAFTFLKTEVSTSTGFLDSSVKKNKDDIYRIKAFSDSDLDSYESLPLQVFRAKL